jgi:hypothetical protein
MQKITILTLLFGLIACTQHSTNNTKQLDFGSFTIEAPNNWTPIKQKGIDSYIGLIAIDKKDTLSFDLGWYTDMLYETDITILDSSMIGAIDTNTVDINSILFVKNSSLVDLDKYRKNNISWDSINGFKAKIVSPRKSGIGITGIYIDSVRGSGPYTDRFNLYGTNLTPENEKDLLKVFKTLKFKKH